MPFQAKIKHILQETYSQWQVTNLGPLGAGIEFVVYAADSAAFGPIALRVPRQRIFQNANDYDLDSRALLTQEFVLARHLGSHGLPTPAVYHLHTDSDLDFLVSERVEHDGTPLSLPEMGRLAAIIHGSPVPPDLQLAAMNGQAVEATLAERLTRRMAVVEELSGRRFPLPPQAEVQRLLTWPTAKAAILHMDLHTHNLLTRAGSIVAVVDWTNALVGDPALDLARASEYGWTNTRPGDAVPALAPAGLYGELSAEFLAGYGPGAPFAAVPPVVQLLYRLDTAVMLANVFLSEAPDADYAPRQLARVTELHDHLQHALR